MRVVLLLCLTFCLASYAKTDNELSSWNTINLDIPITDKTYLRETLSPRLQNTLSEMDVVLLRSVLNYEFDRDLVLSAAYDWFRVFNRDSSYENRFWQQVYYRHDSPIEDLRVFHRFRVDERMLEDMDTQVRLRYMIGLEKNLNPSLVLQLSDELMLNLNADAGLDQNRVYLGLLKTFNPSLSMNAGYQYQHFLGDRDLINHGIIIAVNFSLRNRHLAHE